LWGDSVNPAGTLKETRIHDLAPTILHLLDLPVPADMDGRVLTEALQEGWMANHPVQYEREEERGEKENLIYSEREEKEIREQLKGLGYLG
jgi:arylsulfatase A-like enzyme